MKENLEHSSEMQEEISIQAIAGEEEVVVDNVDAVPISISNKEPEAPREFVVGPQQVLSLDHAVLQSIDRCGKYTVMTKINTYLITFFFINYL